MTYIEAILVVVTSAAVSGSIVSLAAALTTFHHARNAATYRQRADDVLDALDAADPDRETLHADRLMRDLLRMDAMRAWMRVPCLRHDRRLALIRAGIEPGQALKSWRVTRAQLDVIAALRGLGGGV